MAVGLLYLFFELVVIDLSLKYFPKSKFTKKLLWFTTRKLKRVKKTPIIDGQLNLMEDYDSEMPDDSSSM